jgi:hypothetical protein
MGARSNHAPFVFPKASHFVRRILSGSGRKSPTQSPASISPVSPLRKEGRRPSLLYALDHKYANAAADWRRSSQLCCGIVVLVLSPAGTALELVLEGRKCAATLDILRACEAIDAKDAADGKRLVVRVVAMLTKMSSPSMEVRDASEYEYEGR